MIKSALRRFKCLGGLNSAGNVGNGVGTFGKFRRTLWLLARASRLRTSDRGIFLPEGDNTQLFFTTFRVPYAVLRDGGEQFWCFLLADLSVGVQTAARAPFCPLFAGIHR